MKMEWFDEHENLLKEWAEKARCYAWMHHKTSMEYSLLNHYLTVPLIIFSSISASANLTLVGNKDHSYIYNTILPLTIGSFSIITAVLSALTKYIKSAELSEKHMSYYRNFNKLVRNICLELSLPPDQRKPPFEMCNVFRHEFDGLMNEAPNIPEHVIILFNKTFPRKKNKPEITSVFEKINIYGRNKILKDKESELRKIRHFYKWVAIKRKSIDNDLHERTVITDSNNEFQKLETDIEKKTMLYTIKEEEDNFFSVV